MMTTTRGGRDETAADLERWGDGGGGTAGEGAALERRRQLLLRRRRCLYGARARDLQKTLGTNRFGLQECQEVFKFSGPAVITIRTLPFELKIILVSFCLFLIFSKSGNGSLLTISGQLVETISSQSQKPLLLEIHGIVLYNGVYWLQNLPRNGSCFATLICNVTQFF